MSKLFAGQKFSPEWLEFESGQLVKVNGARPEYMHGYDLFWLVRAMAQALAPVQEAGPVAEGEKLLGSRPDFHASAVEQLAFELAFELEAAELSAHDLVTVNREKLRAIAERVLARPAPAPIADETRAEIERLRAVLEGIAERTHERGTKAAVLAALAQAPDGKAEEVEKGFQPMETAPRNAKEIILRVPCKGFPDFYRQIGHWAEDMSGEEQPPFRGWFKNNGYGFSQISPDPTGWMPLAALKEPAT